MAGEAAGVAALAAAGEGLEGLEGEEGATEEGLAAVKDLDAGEGKGLVGERGTFTEVFEAKEAGMATFPGLLRGLFAAAVAAVEGFAETPAAEEVFADGTALMTGATLLVEGLAGEEGEGAGLGAGLAAGTGAMKLELPRPAHKEAMVGAEGATEGAAEELLAGAAWGRKYWANASS